LELLDLRQSQENAHTTWEAQHPDTFWQKSTNVEVGAPAPKRTQIELGSHTSIPVELKDTGGSTSTKPTGKVETMCTFTHLPTRL